jgi:hypothetical protein
LGPRPPENEAELDREDWNQNEIKEDRNKGEKQEWGER